MNVCSQPKGRTSASEPLQLVLEKALQYTQNYKETNLLPEEALRFFL